MPVAKRVPTITIATTATANTGTTQRRRGRAGPIGAGESPGTGRGELPGVVVDIVAKNKRSMVEKDRSADRGSRAAIGL